MRMQPRRPGDPPALFTTLLNAIRSSHKKSFRLHWCGTKIPRGASIDGTAIAWTQNGLVVGAGGESLGYYTRTEEWTGANRDEHEMIISTEGTVQCPVQAMITIPVRRHPRKKRRLQKKWLTRYGTKPIPDPSRPVQMFVEQLRFDLAMQTPTNY